MNDNKKYIKSIEKTWEELNTTNKVINESLLESGKKIEEMFDCISQPIRESTEKIASISQMIQEYISNITKSINYFGSSDEFKRIMDAISSTQEMLKNLRIDEYIKQMSRRLIENGIYTYSGFAIYRLQDNDINIDEMVFEIIDEDKNLFEEDIIKQFPEYKDEIKECYNLYLRKEYRLCILSLINIISNVYNDKFEHNDFTGKDFKRYIKNNNLINGNNDFYLEIMPFIYYDINNIQKTYIEDKEKYDIYSYNRNAIIHGYSKEYGTRENCLRYFSVLINTKDIVKEFIK